MAVAGSVGVMGLDPGGVSGVAQCLFDLEGAAGVWDAFRRAGSATGALTERAPRGVGGNAVGRFCSGVGGSIEVFEVGGDEREQGLTLAAEWRDWYFRCTVELGVPVTHMYLVIEDWIPRLPLKSGERSAFSPIRVSERFLGMIARWEPAAGCLVWQSASEAKTYATDKRLRNAGLWVPGKAHRRDALRHVGALLDRLM